MTVIDSTEAATRDWDWFASDPDGAIGHFTTAGIRPLPKTVKQDRDAALRLIKYFFEEAARAVPHKVRPEAERDSGGWRDESVRSRYLKDFVKMASAGLFSYNTPVSGRNTNYFLVAFPEQPLRADQLPPEIRDLVARTKSPYLFAKTAYISDRDTSDW
jgi:hypothetical protein